MGSSLATTFCGIELEHPVVNGSGTLDALVAGTLGASAFVTKTVTLRPRAGNPPQRIAETPAGMVNSIGLANPGLDRFCDDHLPRLADLGVPLIVSVGGWSREEYATAVARVGAQPAVAAIELNVSCPNVDTGCISIGTDAAETRALLERCRAETSVPLSWAITFSTGLGTGRRVSSWMIGKTSGSGRAAAWLWLQPVSPSATRFMYET